jgi:protein import protein ZIM17
MKRLLHVSKASSRTTGPRATCASSQNVLLYGHHPRLPSKCTCVLTATTRTFSSSEGSTDPSLIRHLSQEVSSVPADTSDTTGTHLTIPGSQTGAGRKLAIVFTCTVCETRSAKQFTERAYEHGVVIIRCPGCQNLHLIVDRLGYFDEGHFDLETIEQMTGQDVKRVSDADGALEIDLETLLGTEKMEELRKKAQEVVETKRVE